LKEIRTLAVLLPALLLLGACAAPEEAADDPRIRIGAYFPMTGPYAAGGQMTMEGIAMARDRRPEALGKPVELVLVDNKSEKVESANAVSRLIESERVVAVLGTYASSNAIAGAEVCEKARVPMLAASATNPLVTEGKAYSFRACFIDPFQGWVVAKYAVEELDAGSAVVLQDIAADYSVGLTAFFRRAFAEFTGDAGAVQKVLNYQTGDQDFTAQLTVAKRLGPDVLFVPGYFGDLALIAKQAKELGIEAQILAADAAQAPELIEIGGEDVEGLVFSNHYTPEQSTDEAGQEFVRLYAERYGKTPNAFAALGYDTYNMLLDVIEASGSADPEAIRAGLQGLKGYHGVTGIISIDENGDAVKSAVMLTVRDGKFEFVQRVDPE
jgi:branched-chain amino acid transport system substrate-binding protein